MSKTFSRTIRSDVSHHTLHISSISREELRTHIPAKEADNYTSFYIVRNFDEHGVTFFYLGKGYQHPDPERKDDRRAHDPKEVVVWYGNGAFFTGRGNTFKEAIENAQKHGWLYACRQQEAN